MGALEGAHYSHSGELLTFSEQHLVDCSWQLFGNHGCSGGMVKKSFKYWMKDNPILEDDYPYIAKKKSCQSKKVDHSDVTVPKYHTIKEKKNPDRMKQAL